MHCQSMYLQIFNEKSKQPVPYVLLQKIDSNYSLNADNVGKVAKNQIKPGKYVLSCISYKTDTFLVTSKTNSIFLKESPIGLSTVEINDWVAGKNSYWFGYHKRSHFFKNVYKGPNNSHLATLIPINNSDVLIEKIVLKGYQIPKKFVFHLSLYQVGEDGKPASQILAKKILHESKGNTLVVELHERVNVENGGLFVGYQWFRYENRSLINVERQDLPRIKMTFNGSEKGTFLLSESGLNFDKVWHLLKYPGQPSYAPRFGIKVIDNSKE